MPFDLADLGIPNWLFILSEVVAVVAALAVVVAALAFGSLWLQAYMSGADVRLISLIGMRLRNVDPRLIVTAKIMGKQAGLNIHRRDGMTTERLEAHVLAGGDVMSVLRAIIAAQRADMDLDFDRAAAIDLAGRNVLDAVKTSVSPMVIDCPSRDQSTRKALSAVAKDGVELLVRVRVTVRTNLDQLIGGATEETIVARVGQGIVSAIGSAETHGEVLEEPSRFSKEMMKHGMDSNTAFRIVSIDIADIDVGQNIGAKLQTDQAGADVRVAQAVAEVRRAEALARQQEMKAQVARRRAELVRAEAEIPASLGAAFRAGRHDSLSRSKLELGPARRKRPTSSGDASTTF